MSHESEIGGHFLFSSVRVFFEDSTEPIACSDANSSHTCFVQSVDVDTATIAGKDTLKIERL